MADGTQDVDGMLEGLLEGKRPEEIVASGGLLEDLTMRVLERALEGEPGRMVLPCSDPRLPCQ